MTESILGNDPQVNQAPQPQDEAPAATGWATEVAEDLRGLVSSKGWQGPEDALRSYKQLESSMGADKAGRGVVLPKGEDDVEGYDKLWQALGRPEDPAGYNLAEVYGDMEADAELLTTFSEVMHKAGLSAGQAKTIASAYKDLEAARAEADASRLQQEYTLADREVPEATKEMARRAMRFLNLPPERHIELSTSLERALGVKPALELMACFGQLLNEDKPPLERSGTGYGFHLSPEAANSKINDLFKDKNFVERYSRSDPSAMAEMERLSRIAVGS